jgi:serine/threonine kinase 16
MGEGGFSFVYLVKSNSYKDEEDAVTSSAPQRPKSKRGSYLYALKRIKIQLEEQERAFEKELHYHKLIGLHPNVITLIDGELIHYGNGIKEGLLLFPFYKKGTWQDLINRSQLNGETVDLKRLMTLFTGVCNGLLAFHQQPTVLAFRDLKPANILIDGTGQSVLMDLGSVQPARFEIRSRAEAVALQDLASETVTAPFRPPELFEVPSQAQFDERTDVWSLGCTFYAMITGSSPFDGSATSAMSGRLNFNPPAFSNYPHSVKTLISSMIVVDLNQRPFVTDILEQMKSLKLVTE